MVSGGGVNISGQHDIKVFLESLCYNSKIKDNDGNIAAIINDINIEFIDDDEELK